MAQEKQESDAEPLEEPTRSLGRGIATLIYWAAVLYVVGAGFISVIPQVFWPEHDALADNLSCESELHTLRNALVERTSERIASAGAHPDAAAENSFFQRWDRRYYALRERCDGSRAWLLVGRLRHRTEATLDRFEQEEGSLNREINATLPPQTGREGPQDLR